MTPRISDTPPLSCSFSDYYYKLLVATIACVHHPFARPWETNTLSIITRARVRKESAEGGVLVACLVSLLTVRCQHFIQDGPSQVVVDKCHSAKQVRTYAPCL